MEVKASCKFDFESVKAFTYLTMFNKGNPKKKMLFSNILFGILLVVLILEIIILGSNSSLIFGAVVAFLGLFLNVYMWFLFPKVRYNALGKMKGVENEYVFTDEKIFVTSNGAEYSGQAEIEYTLLVKVYETSEYFFLYQTKNQVFIVNKSTIQNGTPGDIRNKLSSFLNKKYIICKY